MDRVFMDRFHFSWVCTPAWHCWVLWPLRTTSVWMCHVHSNYRVLVALPMCGMASPCGYSVVLVPSVKIFRCFKDKIRAYRAEEMDYLAQTCSWHEPAVLSLVWVPKGHRPTWIWASGLVRDPVSYHVDGAKEMVLWVQAFALQAWKPEFEPPAPT